MKKLSFISLPLLLIFILSSCNLNPGSSSKEDGTPQGGGGEQKFSLTLKTSGDGQGRVDGPGSTPAGSYPPGTKIKVIASPSRFSQFKGWYDAVEGGKLLSSKRVYAFALNGNSTLYAAFTLITKDFELKLAKDSKGTGQIDGTHSTTKGRYRLGTSVTAKAIADKGSRFLGWYDSPVGGKLISAANPYIFALEENSELYVRFGLVTNNFSLNKTVYGDGSGTIDSKFSTPTGNYPLGKLVKARALPAENSRFAGWYDKAVGGNLISTKNPYNFKLEKDTSLYARFEPLTY